MVVKELRDIWNRVARKTWEETYDLPVAATADTDGLAMRIAAMIAQDGPVQDLREAFLLLANISPPADLARAYDAIAAQVDPARMAQCFMMAPMWNQVRATPQPQFETLPLGSHVTLYRPQPQRGGDRRALVCFSGLKHGLFMPLARFLGDFAIHDIDIVVVRALVPGAYGCGIPGFGDRLGTALPPLQARIAACQTRIGGFFGVSSGGLPALRAAVLAGGCGISLSGRFYRMGGAVPLWRAGNAFDPLCGCTAGRAGQLHHVLSAEHPIDSAQADMLARMNPQVRIHRIQRSTTHDPFPTLAARRRRGAFIHAIAEATCGRDVDLSVFTT